MAAGRINSKKKGSKNERDVCKWWKNWTSYEFTRVPSSGGLRWSRTSDTTGDIICADQKHFLKFPFSIECKFYKNITFNDILKGTKSDILKFWEQAKNDAARGDKEPILFVRENGMSKNLYYVIVNMPLGNRIRDLFLSLRDYNCNSFEVTLRDETIFVFNSNDLAVISYRAIRKGLKK